MYRTDYGLGATIISSNPERAQRVASKIQSGVVFINDFLRSDPRVPFGGTKQSGLGRELGEAGLANYTELKTVTVSLT